MVGGTFSNDKVAKGAVLPIFVLPIEFSWLPIKITIGSYRFHVFEYEIARSL